MDRINGVRTLTQQCYALMQQLQLKPQPYLWVVAKANQVNKITALLKIWRQILHCEIGLDYSLLMEDITASMGYADLLDQQPGIYVITEEQYENLAATMQMIYSSRLIVRTGQNISNKKVKENLLVLGFEFDTTKEPFTFMSKGGFLHVYTPHEQVRLEFGLSSIDAIQVKASKTHDKNKYIFYPQTFVSGASMAPESKVITAIKQIITVKVENEVEAEVDLILAPLASKQAKGVTKKLKTASAYHKKYQDFIKDISKLHDKNYTTVVVVHDSEVINNVIQAWHYEHQDLITIIADPQAHIFDGFWDETEEVVYLGHANIFGKSHREVRKVKEWIKRTKTAQRSFLTSLKPGDYVVHQDHGVGRYKTMKSMKVGDYDREVLEIEYAAGDTLYVPVEMLDKLDSYIGNSKPKLNRLSGVSWSHVKAKVKQDSRELAQNLLRMYAQRELVKLHPWQTQWAEYKALEDSFPYEPTPDQATVMQEIIGDLRQRKPMDRLVVGDVGFGKTEIALRSAYLAVLNNKQVALLCPTTILAEQHYHTFKKRLEPFGVRVEALSRFTEKLQGRKKVKSVIEAIKNNEVDIVIGTHRLLSKDIAFRDLGMLIVDEEQRFGVKHKEKLRQLRVTAHTLTLTATPIPRTLYFSVSGLRDISVISTPPPGRQSIATNIIEYDEVAVQKAISAELKRGGQVYYLYNKVATIEGMAAKLRQMPGLKRAKIAVAHGQMNEFELVEVMNAFNAGTIDVLVCSTIIENGIDLPNVNTLVVHNATSFGLGQLYQLRGRIGRGLVKAHAYFFYKLESLKGLAQDRLAALEEAKELGSGFQLAMRDLEIRGVGNMLGEQQHGHIMTIGLNLYVKLLSQTINSLDSEMLGTPEIEEEREVLINLPIDYRIPAKMIKNENERILLYRQIASFETVTELNQFEIKTYKKYKTTAGQSPQLAHLFTMFRMKLKAKSTDIIAINHSELLGVDDVTYGVIRVILGRNWRAHEIQQLQNRNPMWKVNDKVAKIKMSVLGENWLRQIENVIDKIKYEHNNSRPR